MAARRRLGPVMVAVLLGASMLATDLGPPALAASRYPLAVRHVFVSACSKTAVSVSNGRVSRKTALRYCTRALACISKRLTLKQFVRVVTNMQTGAANPQAPVLRECEKSAARTLGA